MELERPSFELIQDMNPAHSHWDQCSPNGDKRCFDRACYAAMRAMGIDNEYLPIHEIVVYHPTYRNSEWLEDYVSCVINSPAFGETFITKDAKEGLQSGFEINTNTPYNLLRQSLIGLRSAFEVQNVVHSYELFRKAGVDQNLSYFLANLYKLINTEDFSPSLEHSGETHGTTICYSVDVKDFVEGKHFYLSPPTNVKAYRYKEGDGFDILCSPMMASIARNIKEGPTLSICRSLVDKFSGKKVDIGFGQVQTYPEVNEENINLIIDTFKEKAYG